MFPDLPGQSDATNRLVTIGTTSSFNPSLSRGPEHAFLERPKIAIFEIFDFWKFSQNASNSPPPKSQPKIALVDYVPEPPRPF